MSDFITGLRGDLVDAAARHRRRGRLGRAMRPLHPRVWRPATALAAVAIAVSVVAVVIAASTLAPPSPHAGRPQIAAEVRIGGVPQDAVLAGGSLWVADFSGRVVRVDPASRRVTARIDVGGNPRSIAAGAGGVWVISTDAPADRAHLSRIDPRAGRVAERIAVGGYAGGIAVGAGGLWLIPDQHRPRLQRIDPASHAVTARIPFSSAEALAVGGDTLWALGDEGTVVEVDGASGAVRRLPGVARAPSTPAENALAADANGAWVASRSSGTVLRIQAGRVVRRITVGATAGPLVLADGAVWVASGDELRGRFRLSRIEPDSGRVTATLDLGLHQPKALLAAGHDVWVIASDGTALLVTTRAQTR